MGFKTFHTRAMLLVLLLTGGCRETTVETNARWGSDTPIPQTGPVREAISSQIFMVEGLRDWREVMADVTEYVSAHPEFHATFDCPMDQEMAGCIAAVQRIPPLMEILSAHEMGVDEYVLLTIFSALVDMAAHGQTVAGAESIHAWIELHATDLQQLGIIAEPNDSLESLVSGRVAPCRSEQAC